MVSNGLIVGIHERLREDELIVVVDPRGCVIGGSGLLLGCEEGLDVVGVGGEEGGARGGGGWLGGGHGCGRAEKLGVVLISNNCFDGSCGIGFDGTV